jgi:hydroxymethylglutaryl-CoA reductase
LDFIPTIVQQIADNVTSTLLPAAAQNLVQTVDSTQSTTTALIGTTIATVGGLIGKHLYDGKKRSEVVTTASDIDKMQMAELADNYNDFSQFAGMMEDFMRLIVTNPDSKLSDILNMVVDDVTKQTMGMKLVEFFQNIQKYNQEYYKNTAFKPNAMTYSSNNPLKQVRALVKDMSTPSNG